MKEILKYIFVFSAIISLISISYAEKPPTNEEFVTRTVASEFKSLLDSLKIESGRMLFEPQTGMNSLIIDGVKSGAISAGLKVMSVDNQFNTGFYYANVTLSSFDFSYENGDSRGFLKQSYIRRDLSGQMLVNITNDDFNYLGYRNFSGSDQVSPDMVNYISSVRYNQLAPDPPGDGFKKYLEPLAVTATVGGLIYLFFINR